MFPPESSMPVRLYFTTFRAVDDKKIAVVTPVAVMGLESEIVRPWIAATVVPEAIPGPATPCAMLRLRGEMAAGSVKKLRPRVVAMGDRMAPMESSPTLVIPVVSSKPVTLA